MKKLLLTSILSTLVLTANTSNASSSWFENLFGGDNDQEKHEKNKHKNKNKEDKHYHKNSNKRQGPPDHAKAHGYRAKFKHYPEANIYQNTETGVFFEKRGNAWQPVYEIPSHINLGNGISVNLDEAIPEFIKNFQQ